MRRIFLFLMSVCLTLLDCPGAGTRLHKCTMRNQGVEREYFLYLPEKMIPEAPLVLALHGYGGRAMQSGESLCELAEKEGFAVCFPQGYVDGRGSTCWNVGYTFQKDMEIDDVKFLCDLSRHLCKQYGLNRKNVFCTGMSNGGEMCYLLAYLKPDVFTAVAPIAGLTLEWMYRQLEPSRPVPLMEIHGTEDRVSYWNGNLEDEFWGKYISVPMAVGIWAAEARCTHEITQKLPLVRNEVILHQFANGIPAWENGPEIEVRLYEIQNGVHSYALEDMDTWSEIWQFFRLYLR